MAASYSLGDLDRLYKNGTIDKPQYNLYSLGLLTTLLVEGSKLVINDNATQYAFRYKSTVDYSEKLFACSQAAAAMKFYNISDKEKMLAYIEKLKKTLDVVAENLKQELHNDNMNKKKID